MKKLIFFVFFLSISYSGAKIIDNEKITLIDSALGLINMNQRDMAMPYDYVSLDSHRLGIIKKIFDNPLYGFEYIDKMSKNIRESIANNNADFLYDLADDIQNTEIVPKKKYEQSGIDIDIEELPDSISNQIKNILLPVLNFNAEIEQDILRQNYKDGELLFSLFETLVSSDDDNENLNLYEMKDKEVLAHETALIFFDSLTIIEDSRLYHIAAKCINIYLSMMNDISYIGSERIEFQTEAGPVVFGTPDDDFYDKDYAFIFDPSGNDIYKLSSMNKYQCAQKPSRVIIDISGDDKYLSSEYGHGCALFGMSLMIDLAGNDIYSSGKNSLGCGIFGLSLLYDAAGDDIYSGHNMTQASGTFGIGVLIDKSGNDSYSCHSYSQGFAYTRGYGVLIDISGNDQYSSSSPGLDILRYEDHFISFAQGASIGFRPIASGGIGLLFDYQGNDSYLTDIFGQATAYWYSLGGLADFEGNDRYISWQYAQGSGVHMAHGLLYDKSGDDAYISHGVSMGCGHDVAFGSLIDEAGDDVYFVESLSLGGGNANAVSLFLDQNGDDAYFAQYEKNCLGYSDYRRRYGMIGLFIDGGGDDAFGEKSQGNTEIQKSTYGIAIEFENTDKPAKKATEETKQTKHRLTSTVDSLFIQASAAPLKYQSEVKPAREKIIEIGADALNYLAGHISTGFPRDRHALEDILVKMHKTDTAALERFILDSLRSKNERTISMCAKVAARIKLKSSIDRLSGLIESDNWRIRALAARHTGDIFENTNQLMLAALLDDEHPYVRMRAAHSIGQIHPENVLFYLTTALEDSMQIVRKSAVQGIIRNKPLDYRILKDAFTGKFSDPAKIDLAMIIPHANISKAEYKKFERILFRMPKKVRKSAYMAIMSSDSEVWIDRLETMYNREKDGNLKDIIAKFMTKK